MSKSIEQHTLRTSRSLLRGLLVLALASVASVASLGGGTLVGSQTASAAPPPQTDKDKAREFFLEGDALFKKELYSAAIENFKKANELYPHPINLYNIARGYEKLGDADNCIKVYNDYLDFHRRQNNGKDPSDLVDVKASIAKCQLLQKPEVTIDSDPYGAAIYLDDKTKLVGQTPITLKLDPGKYKLYLNLDGYVPFEQDLQVSTGQPMTLKFKLEKFQRVGKVRVKSNVRGATVFVDGRNVGLTPYSDTITLEEGAHQIAVSKDEYVPFNREVKVTVNQTEEITAQIFLRDAPATWKGYVGWTSIILGVGAGVGGYFAGVKADEYFNDTKDFDKWSGLQKIGYGVGGGLVGAGILLVILEATDTQLIKSDDELDPMANAPRSPSVKPFVSAGGLVGADVRF
ncbi:MAG: PEGA domain-containing protein [Deltaproteobacteria bacterium]|jgi:hypothetical protein|nr:PEGA domain-containing protein [Deltaproteobacteria bacterium]